MENAYWKQKMPRALATALRDIPEAADIVKQLDRPLSLDPTRLSALLDSAMRMAARHGESARR